MKMKTFLISLISLISLTLISAPKAFAIKYVRGYYKPSTYKYVAPHYRTNSNSYKYDNYSSKGNINPFTGKKGYKNWY